MVETNVNVLSFEELEEKEFLTGDDLEATFGYYARSGLGISAQKVIRMINRADLSPIQKEKLSDLAKIGIKVMADYDLTKEADQYALVRIALRG